MVRLNRPGRDQGCCTQLLRVGDQELELACLVASKAQRRQVVTLDQNAWTRLRTAESVAEPGRFMQRRRQARQRQARLGGERVPDSSGGRGAHSDNPNPEARSRMSSGKGASMTSSRPVRGCLKATRHE